MTDVQLTKLRKGLPRKATALIHCKTGVSISQIHKILRGLHKNTDVIQSAIEIALEEKKRITSLSKQVESL